MPPIFRCKFFIFGITHAEHEYKKFTYVAFNVDMMAQLCILPRPTLLYDFWLSANLLDYVPCPVYVVVCKRMLWNVYRPNYFLCCHWTCSTLFALSSGSKLIKIKRFDSLCLCACVCELYTRLPGCLCFVDRWFSYCQTIAFYLDVLFPTEGRRRWGGGTVCVSVCLRSQPGGNGWVSWEREEGEGEECGTEHKHTLGVKSIRIKETFGPLWYKGNLIQKK